MEEGNKIQLGIVCRWETLLVVNRRGSNPAVFYTITDVALEKKKFTPTLEPIMCRLKCYGAVDNMVGENSGIGICVCKRTVTTRHG